MKNAKRFLAIALAAVLALSMASCSFIGSGGGSGSGQKEYTQNGMAITLPDNFKDSQYEGYTAAFESNEAVVFALKEEFSLQEGVEDYTVEEYAQLVCEANSESNPSAVKKVDGLTAIEFENVDDETGATYSYFASMYKASDAFWLVQFSCDKENYAEYYPQFVEWAKTVNFPAE